MQIRKVLKKFSFLTMSLLALACSGASGSSDNNVGNLSVNDNGEVVSRDSEQAVSDVLPFTDDTREHVVNFYGKRTIRSEADVTISQPQLVRNRHNLFIVMSKKDFYLYVYEAQGQDTVMIARYDCCFSLKKGQKQQRGDMKTPSCTPRNPFKITQIQNASSWCHNFGDGRGNIRAYGDWFLRLLTPGHSGIGIHGSTNNRESVPGRASEGCIRLLDEDINDLRNNYAFQGMKVIIKDEKVDDYPFEIRAMKKQNIQRRRHFDPKKTLTNEQIAKAPLENNFKPGKRQPMQGVNDGVAGDYDNGESFATDDNGDYIYTDTEEPQPTQESRNKTLEEVG